MPFRSTTSTSKSFLAYILSLVGLDIFTSTRRRLCTPSIQSSTSTLTNSTVLTESTLFVTPLDYYDPFTKPPVHDYEPWALDTWICELPKVALVHLVSRIAFKFPGLVEDTIADTNDFKSLPLCTPGMLVLQDLEAVQRHAHAMAHQLDGLRPSEQFARADEVTQALHQLVRVSVSTFHTPVHGRSIMALLALLIIVLKSFEAPSEVRQHIYCHAKFGRTIVLEMAHVVKNDKGAPLSDTEVTHLAELATEMRLLHWLPQLKDACQTLARYDAEWKYRDEYSNVITMLSR